MANQSATPTSAQARYMALENDRSTFLQKARDLSKLTIPSLIPPEGKNPVLNTPYQGMGARGVNNLAAKLLLVLLPPNSPFFRLKPDARAAAELQQIDEAARTKIEAALSQVERLIMDWIEEGAVRVDAFEALKHLIVAGNVLLYVKPKTGLQVFHIDQYVTKRDRSGNVLEIIVKEDVSPWTLPAAVRALVEDQTATQAEASKTDEATVSLYTWIRRDQDAGVWKIHQEIQDKVIETSHGAYPLDRCPWIALRFVHIAGEDYGRSYAEEYQGDLQSLESLSQAIVEGSVAASKVLFGVKPNGTTKRKELEKPNCSIINGDLENDVTVLQVQKFNDFRVARELLNEIEQRLAFAFLLNTSIQRPGERVTAEEIRYMAGELENALGGVYSTLSQEFQLPLVVATMAQMRKARQLPAMPAKSLKPVIVTGLEALGRGQDLNKLNIALGTLSQQLTPQVLAQFINVGDLISRVFTAVGVDPAGLVKNEQQLAAEQQQAQMQQAAQMLTPGAMNIVRDQMKAATDAAQPPAKG